MRQILALIGMAAVGVAAQGGSLGDTATDLSRRVLRLEERAARVDDRVARLEQTVQRSDVTIATLTKQVKELNEAQERLAKTIAIDPAGVRITGNLRLDGNVLEDQTIVNCDAAPTTGSVSFSATPGAPSSNDSARRCTCPDGRVAVGIELRPIALSSMPGPSAYNTALICSRM